MINGTIGSGTGWAVVLLIAVLGRADDSALRQMRVFEAIKLGDTT